MPREDCCAQLPDIDDQLACGKAFDTAIHRRVKKISWQLQATNLNNVIVSESVGSGGGTTTGNRCDLNDNCTLFIFDSAEDIASTSSPATESTNTTTGEPPTSASTSPLPSPLPDMPVIEYDLPLNFTMPFNSAFVGNRKGGRLPEITVENSGHSNFVITANDPQSSYLFRDIEVDSRAEQAPLGVMDLRGAGSVTLESVTVVRNPVPDSASDDPDDIHAIRMGCPDNSNPEYRIIDSEIDLSLHRPKMIGNFRPRFDHHTGEAFHFSNCGGEGEGSATLLLTERISWSDSCRAVSGSQQTNIQVLSLVLMTWTTHRKPH